MKSFNPPALDPKLVAEFFTYSPADIAVMEEQAAAALYEAKRTRFKYASDLKLALRDRPVVERKPIGLIRQERQPLKPLSGEQTAAALCGGVVLAVGGMVVFLLVLWIITGGPFR